MDTTNIADKGHKGAATSSTNASSMKDFAQPAVMSRRAMLRAGTVAMPAILTLHSGAAMARSSNLISASSPRTTDAHGRTLCLDTNSVYRASSRRRHGRVFDLGEPAFARVNVIHDGDHFTKESDSYEYYLEHGTDGYSESFSESNSDDYAGMNPISEGQACLRGGTIYSKTSHGWQQMHLPRNGIVVSATAISSFASGITANYM